MTESEFLDQTAKVWAMIESRVDGWAEAHDIDIEAVRQGPVLELEFESGRKMVINAQAPMQQIWLASPRGAFHFVWNGSSWQDTRQGTDFWQVLAQEAAFESGETLS
ncbi:MAG: iron donor protein CyaY [Burkholderiaceae bacterium]|nr:iron donor protein CyaY [Burkholderiaceae bacterium]